MKEKFGDSGALSTQNRISVCICTFKRPQLLAKLLFALNRQRTDGLFTFSAVIVDNDDAKSARDVVNRARTEVDYRIEYHVEPRQNIALARNKAVLNSQCDFIAMIDDDEIPVDGWLFFLFRTLLSSKADGVLGPVCPSFSPHAPLWLIRSGLCNRQSYRTGTVLTLQHQSRTGNVLFHCRVFDNGKNLFREQFGRTGGEDVDFFKIRIKEGFKFVWCEEASVYEDVLPERCLLSFYITKHIRMGGLMGEQMRNGTFPLWRYFVKSTGVAILYTFMVPVFGVCGKHIFARHLARYVYHISRVLGTLGIVIVRER